ncbi:MAG TPA: hypothetical protein VG267_18085 [Terracidiphilus sp.]|jgi:hypothetical protein|nr:hypothetical protein [Terracidiphilus sp.]
MNSAIDSAEEIKAQRPSGSAARLKLARQLHLYLGTFFAPSIVFFAFTGALQLFSLHEGHPGDAYQPPAWVQKLASIHKDQTAAGKHGPPPGSGPQQGRPQAPDQAHQPLQGDQAPRPPQTQQGPPRNKQRGQSKSTLALKCFFLAMAVSLIFSTLLGIYMAFKYNRSRRLVWGLLILGTVIPVALIAMTA